MARQAAQLRRIFRKVDEEMDMATLHALAVFQSALSEEQVRRELQGHRLELSRMLGYGDGKSAPDLKKAFAENVTNVMFDKKIVPSENSGTLDEALIVEAQLVNGHKIRLLATGDQLTIGIYDVLGMMREEIRQHGNVLELLKGAENQYK